MEMNGGGIKRYNLMLLGLISVIFFTNLSFAQEQIIKPEPVKKSYFWINIGYGEYINHELYEKNTIGAICSFSYQIKYHLFSIRCHVSGSPSDEHRIYTGDLAILYGISKKWRYGMSSISTGIAYTTVDHYPNLFLGIPIEIQLFTTPLCCVGVGIYGLANINTHASFVGAGVCLQLGKLR